MWKEEKPPVEREDVETPRGCHLKPVNAFGQPDAGREAGTDCPSQPSEEPTLMTS